MRVTVLTPEVHALIIQGVQVGMLPEDAARRAGVSKGLFAQWMEAGSTEGHDFTQMNVAQLRELAAEEAVEIPPKARKPAIVTALIVAGIVWDAYQQLRDDIEHEELELEASLLKQWKIHAKSNPHALKEFITRRWPDTWGAKDMPGPVPDAPAPDTKLGQIKDQLAQQRARRELRAADNQGE